MRQVDMEPNLSYTNGTKLDTVSGMVTVVHKFTARLYLREHRKRLGVRSSTVAERMGMERESLLRLERSPQNVDWAKAVAYARALGISPVRLLKPPDRVSLDELVEGESADIQAMAADIVRRLIHK